LVIARDERAVLAAAEKEFRHPVGLIARVDEHFLNAPDKVAKRIVSFSTD
jgi:hypothetical protein